MPEPRPVYVIDDDEAVRESLSLLLESRALPVQTFASAPEFLAVAPSVPPGCVVTDLSMPGMDGLQLLQRLREHNLRLPVIVMTGHGEVSLAVQALKAGAIDFIEKTLPWRRSVRRCRDGLAGDRGHAPERRVDPTDCGALRLADEAGA
jgi:two-component system, LuxR family, response regulator FixJ